MAFLFFFDPNQGGPGDHFYDNLHVGVRHTFLNIAFGNHDDLAELNAAVLAVLDGAALAVFDAAFLAPGMVHLLTNQAFQLDLGLYAPGVEIWPFGMQFLAITALDINALVVALRSIEALNAEAWRLYYLLEAEKKEKRGRCKPSGDNDFDDDEDEGGSGGVTPILAGSYEAWEAMTKEPACCHLQAADERPLQEPFARISGDVCRRPDGQKCNKCWFHPDLYCKKDFKDIFDPFDKAAVAIDRTEEKPHPFDKAAKPAIALTIEGRQRFPQCSAFAEGLCQFIGRGHRHNTWFHHIKTAWEKICSAQKKESRAIGLMIDDISTNKRQVGLLGLSSKKFRIGGIQSTCNTEIEVALQHMNDKHNEYKTTYMKLKDCCDSSEINIDEIKSYVNVLGKYFDCV